MSRIGRTHFVLAVVPLACFISLIIFLYGDQMQRLFLGFTAGLLLFADSPLNVTWAAVIAIPFQIFAVVLAIILIVRRYHDFGISVGLILLLLLIELLIAATVGIFVTA